MATSENADSPFELKFLAETGVFEGYASVFHVIDSAGDRIMPGAFRESLQKLRTENRLPPLLWQHDGQEPIGAWREMHEDGHGLYVKGELFVNDVALAREAYKLLRENVVTGLSIGYRVKEQYRDQQSGIRVLMNIELLEVSLVTFPANDQARIVPLQRFGAKQEDFDIDMEIRELAQRLGQMTEEIRPNVSVKSAAPLPWEMAENEVAAARMLAAYIERVTQDLKAGFDASQSRDDHGRWDGGSGGGKPGIFQSLFGTRPAYGMDRNFPDNDPTDNLLEGGRGTRNSGGGLRGSKPSPLVDDAARRTGKLKGEEFLSRHPTERVTTHGNRRVNERVLSQNEINAAVESAIKTGNMTRKKGKYGTYQYHYKGENGLTVIIETQGRNSGKIITTYGEKNEGKL